jgi:4-amino-4-deoxy-L-arabinose transferase-like glycosyltransferase
VQRSLPSLILLVLISLGTLLFRLGSLPFCGADEPRYARIAQEMHERGVWVTPLLEGKPWLEKPPLYYWMTSPLYAVFDSHETAARIAPAACALASAIAIFFLGSLLWTRRAGMLGSCILITTIGLSAFGRSATTDMPFTCCLTIAMAILAAAAVKEIGWKVLGAYVFLALAVLGKGPIALVLALGIGFCFWLQDERGIILRRWHVLPGLIITAALSIPWFWLAFKQNGYAFLATFFINHNLARYVTDIHHHSAPIYYYPPVMMALFFPWSGWLAMLVSRSPDKFKWLRNWRQWDPGMVFLACWFLFPMVFFSLSDSKLAGYILPSLPPLALIMGVRLSRWIEETADPFLLRAGMVAHLILSLGIAIAAPLYLQNEYVGNWKIALPISFATLVPALFALVYGFKGNCMRAFKATVLQGVAILMAVVLFALPLIGAYHSTSDLSQQALQYRKAGEPIVTFRFFHHSLHYYTGYQVSNEFDTPESLIGFAETHHDFLVVTTVGGWKTLLDGGWFRITLLGKQGNFRLLRISR